jgi:hypothetical protein
MAPLVPRLIIGSPRRRSQWCPSAEARSGFAAVRLRGDFAALDQNLREPRRVLELFELAEEAGEEAVRDTVVAEQQGGLVLDPLLVFFETLVSRQPLRHERDTTPIRPLCQVT